MRNPVYFPNVSGEARLRYLGTRGNRSFRNGVWTICSDNQPTVHTAETGRNVSSAGYQFTAPGSARRSASPHHRRRIRQDRPHRLSGHLRKGRPHQLAAQNGHAQQELHPRNHRLRRLPARLRQRRLARYLHRQRLDLRRAQRQGTASARRALPQQSRRHLHRRD